MLSIQFLSFLPPPLFTPRVPSEDLHLADADYTLNVAIPCEFSFTTPG